jgi:hypothetical protein
MHLWFFLVEVGLQFYGQKVIHLIYHLTSVFPCMPGLSGPREPNRYGDDQCLNWAQEVSREIQHILCFTVQKVPLIDMDGTWMNQSMAD